MSSINVTPPIGAYLQIEFKLTSKNTHPHIPITSLNYEKDLYDPKGSGELETPYDKTVYETLGKYGDFELSWIWKTPSAPEEKMNNIMSGTIKHVKRGKNHIIVSFVDHGQKLEKKTIKVLPPMKRSDAIKKIIQDAGLNPILNWKDDDQIKYTSLRPVTTKKGRKNNKNNKK